MHHGIGLLERPVLVVYPVDPQVTSAGDHIHRCSFRPRGPSLYSPAVTPRAVLQRQLLGELMILLDGPQARSFERESSREPVLGFSPGTNYGHKSGSPGWQA